MKCTRTLVLDALTYARRIIRGLQQVEAAVEIVELARHLENVAQREDDTWLCFKLQQALRNLFASWNEKLVVENWQPVLVTEREFFGITRERKYLTPVRSIAIEDLLSACNYA